MTSNNPLSAETLDALIKQLLPDGTSLANAATAIAALVHALHTSLGFRLVRPASEQQSSTSSSSSTLPSSWIARCSEDESFALSYRHEQSSLLFEIRITRLGTRVVVNAVAVEDNKTATLDVQGDDYLSRSSLPKTVDDSFTLQSIFNSESRLKDFISLYKVQIIQKLIPGLVKPGYTEEEGQGGSARPPAAGPSAPTPNVPEPDYPDRGGVGRAPQLPFPGQNPLEIGRSDLDPLGGQVGRYPNAGGDGMILGPGHPLFNREREQNDPLRIPGTGGIGGGAGRGQTGPWGGDGFLPPLGAPPGARFDPVGPFAPGGGPNMPRRNWGDEMPPPGFDNEGGGFGAFNPSGGFGRASGPSRGPGGGSGGFGNMFM